MLISFIFSYLEIFLVVFYSPFIFLSGEAPARAAGDGIIHPPDGISVILGTQDYNFWVSYPPLMGFLSFCHPGMTVSGCYTPPQMGNSSF